MTQVMENSSILLDPFNFTVSNTINGNVTTLDPGASDVWARYTLAQFLDVFCPVALHVDRCITPIWYLVGITGNVLAAKIWTEKRMRTNNSSAIYLATLSVTDMLFLLLHVFMELKYAWDVDTLNYPGICEGYNVVYMMAQYSSPLLVLGFTVERYIAICHPFQKEKFCTTSRAIKVVIGLVLTSLALCLIQSYFWTYKSEQDLCTIREAAMVGGNVSLWSIWTWTTEMLIFMVVPLVILIFNILVIREVRRISRSGQAVIPGQAKPGSASRATTVMLLSVSFYVIFTTLPATIVYALQIQEGDPAMTDQQIKEDSSWHSYLVYLTSRKIIEEICLSHYACNFFLYIITGVHFRTAFLEMFNCCKVICGTVKNAKYTEISQKTHWQTTHTTNV